MSTRFDLKLFRVFLKYRLPGKLILPFFSRKVSTVTFSEGGYTLSRLQNDKISNIITCFHHFVILAVAKTSSRVKTATTFSRQNDAGSHASTT